MRVHVAADVELKVKLRRVNDSKELIRRCRDTSVRRVTRQTGLRLMKRNKGNIIREDLTQDESAFDRNAA